MQRYSVYQFDRNTFVVIDQVERKEVCTCSNYDEWEDAEERAQKITLLLNASGEKNNKAS